jgi:hypothetical protein
LKGVIPFPSILYTKRKFPYLCYTFGYEMEQLTWNKNTAANIREVVQVSLDVEEFKQRMAIKEIKTVEDNNAVTGIKRMNRWNNA